MTTKTTATARPLRKHALRDLIDELGTVRAELAVLQDRESALKAEIIARRVVKGDGARYRLVLTSATRFTLDVNRLRLEYGESWYDKHCRMSAVVSLKVTPRVMPPAALAVPVAEAA